MSLVKRYSVFPNARMSKMYVKGISVLIYRQVPALRFIESKHPVYFHCINSNFFSYFKGTNMGKAAMKNGMRL